MKQLIYGVLVALLIIPIVSGNNITNATLNPGGNLSLNCTNETINESWFISCSIEDCPRCVVDTSIEPGEEFSLVDGNCDFHMYCDPQACPEGVVEFPGNLTLLQTNTSLDIFYEIYDFKGSKIVSRTWDFYDTDYLRYVTPLNFQCPGQLTAEISYVNCVPYLDQYFRTSDPLLMELVTGQMGSTEAMVEAESKLMVCIEQRNNWENSHDSIMKDYLNQVGIIDNQTSHVNRLEIELYKIKTTPSVWQIATYGLIIILILFYLILKGYLGFGFQ